MPIVASCTRGSTPARRSAPVDAAPAIAPTLNIACRLLITVRPDRLSSAVPSVLIATSNRLIAMPNSSIAGSSSQRVPQTSASASIAPITAAASAQALRAPMRPISRPAPNSEITAPVAAASSTVESMASPSAYCVLTDGMCTPQAPPSIPSAANWMRVAHTASERVRASHGSASAAPGSAASVTSSVIQRV